MEEISTDHVVLFTKTYICIIQHYYNRLQKLCSLFIRNWNLMVSTAHNFALNSFVCISQTLWNIKVHPGTLHNIFINKLIATNFGSCFYCEWNKPKKQENLMLIFVGNIRSTMLPCCCYTWNSWKFNQRYQLF